MASNSKKRRRVLGASCILAALIIASSSFAWFTGKDEVTNRLTATADYGVAIAEDFTPPEKWVPGQPINKDVSATNTGSVDAFVRMYMDGEMRVLKTTGASEAAAKGKWDTDNATFTDAISSAGLNKATGATPTPSEANDVEDPALVAMGLTKVYKQSTSNAADENVSYYYKMLSTTSTKNPRDNQTTEYQNDYANESETDYYSEVQAMQAGGVLAYAPSNAEYTYILNQEAELPIYSKTTDNKFAIQTRKVPANTRVYVLNPTKLTIGATGVDNWAVATNADMSTVGTVYVPAQTYTATAAATEANHFNPVNVDADSFQPLTAGLYLFARNEDLKETAKDPNNYEFSGYYYSQYDTKITSADGKVTMTHELQDDAVANTIATTTSYKADDYDITKKFKDADGDYGKGTYYALKAENDLAVGDNRSDYTVPNGKTDTPADTTITKAITVTELDNDLYYIYPTADLELYTAKYTTIDTSKLKWFYTADALSSNKIDNAVLHAWYDADGDADSPTASAKFNKDADILIDIALKNVGNKGDTWTVISDGGALDLADVTTLTDVSESSDGIVPSTLSEVNKKWTFYYNDDVESGDTTERLIDTVTLNKNVTNKAYLAFDFDLNVYLNSAQITYAEDGKEMTTPVEASGEFSTSDDGKATGAQATAQSVAEISDIAWAKAT